MIESTNVSLVAPGTVAFDSLVLVGMVQALHCRVALRALESHLTLIPAKAVL